MTHPGPLIIVSGPSGSGKSTLIRRLLGESRWPLRPSVSVTTRLPREGEENGVHYYFWDRAAFEAEISAGGFIEWADVFGNYYGTLKREVEPYLREGVGVLLEIDVQGWQQVKRHCSGAASVFVRASGLESYEKRLRERGTESEPAIQRRLQGAREELACASAYEFQVINEDFEHALNEMRSIIDKLFYNRIEESHAG